MYFLFEGMLLPDATLFSYGYSFCIRVSNDSNAQENVSKNCSDILESVEIPEEY